MKQVSTKKALIASVLSMLVCVSMLIGSTFAWFTDSASTNVNVIKAGNLKVDIVNEADASLNGGTLEFKDVNGESDILWEPGVTFNLDSFRIVNKGNLALKYQVLINGLNGDSELLDVIDFTVKKGDADPVALADWSGVLLPAGATATDGADVEKTALITISGHMREDAGNDYMGKTLDGISIKVIATQYAYENDSNGNTYDENAPYVTVDVADEKELRTALYNAPADGANGVKIVLQDDVTLEMMYSGESYHDAGDNIADNADGDTLSRYKTITNDWDLINKDENGDDKTVEQKSEFGAYYYATDMRIARLVVKKGQNVIIDLNGHNLQKADGAAPGSWSATELNLIANYGTLKIIDGEGTGLITGSGMVSCSPAVIQNYGGVLTISASMIDGGADYTDAKTGQYVLLNGDKDNLDLYSEGKMILDGTFVYDGATSASLLYNAAGGTVIKNGAKLTHVNTKTINVKGGEVVIDGAIIKSNNKAVYVEGGKVVINDLVINGSGVIETVSGSLVDNRG